MSRVLPILFNTDMVREIMDGRKTVTRRVVKVPPYYPHFYKLHDNTDGAITGIRNRLYAGFYKDEQIFYIDGEKHVDAVYYQAPYQPGDILYVRETVWQKVGHYLDVDGETKPSWYKEFKYAATDEKPETGWNYSWAKRPSIHMPKEAARIWLKVKDVRVERLQEMNEVDTAKEGIRTDVQICRLGDPDFIENFGGIELFKDLWNSTIKKYDLDRYGWDANPYVWVIEFERCENPDEITDPQASE